MLQALLVFTDCCGAGGLIIVGILEEIISIITVLGVIGLKFGPFSLVTAGAEGDFFVVLFVVSPQASV